MNTFKKLGNDWQKINGSHFLGELEVTYDDLIEKLGTPSGDGDGYKVDAEWVIEFDDGMVGTIYNYKDGINYLGEMGFTVKDICNWHIGGFSKEFLNRVYSLFNI